MCIRDRTYTGRTQKHEVIAYQVRQSFKPGEVTPEEANAIGYEFASRFLKGNHAFIIATHCDVKHIHNHIEWNAVSLDAHHKFKDFSFSARAVARLSDMICLEHKLSVVKHPQHTGKTYNKWLGEKAVPNHRDVLRTDIDQVLEDVYKRQIWCWAGCNGTKACMAMSRKRPVNRFPTQTLPNSYMLRFKTSTAAIKG